MADAEIFALLNHIKDIGERTEEKLDSHIERDERRDKDFLLPLWNEHQRRIGEENAETKIESRVATRGKVAGFLVNVFIAAISALAAVKAIR